MGSQQWTPYEGGLRRPLRNKPLVSLCDATHCSKASALQTRFDAAAVNCDGFKSGYTEIISCNNEVMTPVTKVSHAPPSFRGVGEADQTNAI